MVNSKFRQFSNKTSTKKARSRFNLGGKVDTFVDRLGWWMRKESLGGDDLDIVVYTIPLEVAGRPDLISEIFYQTSRLEWFVLQYNNIVDINEELAVGKIIRLPPKNALSSLNFERSLF